MTQTLNLNTLEQLATEGKIDTVLVALVDMQGRLMGKRFHVRNFLESGYEETHCCTYLLATDLEMATPDGYAATGWQSGYGDYVIKSDLSTLRLVPWLEGTALVIGDVLDHHDHKPIAHSPRAVLKHQIERLKNLGFEAMMATELEFYLFEQSYRDLFDQGYRDLRPLAYYNQDYHLLSTTKEEQVMRRLRNALYDAGIPIENSKGEAEVGQEELNIRYSEALACADYHTISKHATKEIAWQEGRSASFIPKWHHDRVGSSSHIHVSLWQNGEPSFYDPKDKLGMSQLMKHFMAGVIKFAPDYVWFLAPYVNSYKRFVKGTFAPTKTVWSVDNRTAGFRLCGDGTKAVRFECRIGGSDLNPYLGQAALIAAGIKGLEEEMELAPPAQGDAYDDDSNAQNIPANLREAIITLNDSPMLREAMGDDVIDHYVRCAQWEQEEFDRVVTDWEIARSFEKA